MPPLDPKLRRKLENTIVAAREAAEKAARSALVSLAVAEEKPFSHLDEDRRELRRRLRAKMRQLGGGFDVLAAECAYEQWHRMLFARFLAENGLLMHPEGVPVSMADCAELAPEEGDADGWMTASRYAQNMLPEVFRGEDPLLSVRFFPEGRRAMISAMEGIPKPAFSSDDGLGWTYQFWQTKAKKEVNESGRKIGGKDLPAVTQLFTEDYMVEFLLHNSLGAWYAARHPESHLLETFSYLRMDDETGTPAAGAFEGWPETAAEVTVLDPCAGSGHFLVAAAGMLAEMRSEEEKLSPADAADAVLRDNLFGLELDGRCAQIAAFSLALWAWKRGEGHRPIPAPHVAWSGTPAGGSPEEWAALARGDHDLENTLRRLHKLFRDAPDLGSLIDPSRVAEGRDFAKSGTEMLGFASVEEVEGMLDAALGDGTRAGERPGGRASDGGRPGGSGAEDVVAVRGDGASGGGEDVFAGAARGISRAASLMRRRYTLVATNVPYLGNRRQGKSLREFLETQYPRAKNDLATAFLERCRNYCAIGGTHALVSPQYWLFLTGFKKLRPSLLTSQSWHFVATLGSGAFETISGEVVKAVLTIMSNVQPKPNQNIIVIDVGDMKPSRAKADGLASISARYVKQSSQLDNPDSRIVIDPVLGERLLESYAIAPQGIKTGDDERWRRRFWEILDRTVGWELAQNSVKTSHPFEGREFLIDWRSFGQGMVRPRLESPAVGRIGIGLSQMQNLPATLYAGQRFFSSVGPIIPKNPNHTAAIWVFCTSAEYLNLVRKLDKKTFVTNQTLLKVPFDLERWRKVAEERYPDGLPEPYSDDPTQWLFHGHPARAAAGSGAALHVGVARLLGYRWPAEAEGEAERMKLSAEGREWVERASARLESHTDPDGIVCLPAVAGEKPAAERLRALLAAAWEDAEEEWTPSVLDRLLSEAGSGGGDLGSWLWRDFFRGHCRLFHNRPFVWHVTDGRRDGFSALVGYHKLDRQKLEKLIYVYLGDYIHAQTEAAANEQRGADLRLAAAGELKKNLENILVGEKPYDIYVRWKNTSEQPIGWNPDINDGVRINIRPFVEAGVLRSKFNVHWKKDRGRNPDGSERHNDVHLTRAEKEEARRRAAEA